MAKEVSFDELPHGAAIIRWDTGAVEIRSDHGTYVELTQRQWDGLKEYIIDRGISPS